MANVSYSLKHKGVRLLSSSDAWVQGSKGKRKLNPKYTFIGKIDTSLPNIVITASDRGKPKYKGNTNELPTAAKKQIVEHFFDDVGKRNKNKVAYFGIPKPDKKKK